MKTKAEIRKEILEKRDAVKETERMGKSARIFARVRSHPYYQEAEAVLCYVSFRSEVDTLEFLERCLSDEKRLYCPRVIGGGMEFFEIRSLADLRPGYQGIWEPFLDESRRYFLKDAKTLMIMPGVAFDKKNHRIGYGGGFYDRYLAKIGPRRQNFHTMAVALAIQVLQEVPCEEQDVCPELVITEEG